MILPVKTLKLCQLHYYTVCLKLRQSIHCKQLSELKEKMLCFYIWWSLMLRWDILIHLPKWLILKFCMFHDGFIFVTLITLDILWNLVFFCNTLLVVIDIHVLKKKKSGVKFVTFISMWKVDTKIWCKIIFAKFNQSLVNF